MRELLLDANVLVRFLVQDEPKHGAAAIALFEEAEQGDTLLHLDALVLAETVYVLMRPYRRGRNDISNALMAIIQSAGVRIPEVEIAKDALRRFAATNVDFADAWLAARAAKTGLAVASFDRDFDKFKDVRREEPKV